MEDHRRNATQPQNNAALFVIHASRSVFSPWSRIIRVRIHPVRMDVVAGNSDELDGGLDSMLARTVTRSSQGDWKVDSRH